MVFGFRIARLVSVAVVLVGCVAPWAESSTWDESPSWGLELEVIDRDTGRAVPHATVVYSDHWLATGPLVRIAAFLAEDIEAGLGGHGLRFRCDGRGRVRVPFVGGGACVIARAGERSGVLDLQGVRSAAEPRSVFIDRCPPARVRVRDASGRPVAGVPVHLRCQVDMKGEVATLVRKWTDAAGIARFHHLDQLEQRSRAAYGVYLRAGDVVDSADVALPMFASRNADEGVRKRLVDDVFFDARATLRHPEDGAIELTLPASGSVVVTARDSGTLANKSARAVLLPARFGEVSFEHVEALLLTEARQAWFDTSGQAVFRYVPLHQPLIAVVWRGELARWVQVAVPPVKAPGATQRVSVELPRADGLVRGVARDRTGAALAHARLVAHLETREEDWYRQVVRTDMDGRWALRPIEREDASSFRRLRLELWHHTAPQFVTTELAGWDGRSDYRCGDLQLAPVAAPLEAFGLPQEEPEPHVGGSELRVQLRLPGAVDVRFLRLSVHGHHFEELRATREPGVYFARWRLPEGDYELGLHRRAAGEVARWKFGHHGRPVRIDGRGALRVLTVDVRDSKGMPIETVRFATSPGLDGDLSIAYPLRSRSGSFRYLAPRSAKRLHVSAKGFREAVVPLARDALTIVLHPQR